MVRRSRNRRSRRKKHDSSCDFFTKSRKSKVSNNDRSKRLRNESSVPPSKRPRQDKLTSSSLIPVTQQQLVGCEAATVTSSDQNGPTVTTVTPTVNSCDHFGPTVNDDAHHRKKARTVAAMQEVATQEEVPSAVTQEEALSTATQVCPVCCARTEDMRDHLFREHQEDLDPLLGQQFNLQKCDLCSKYVRSQAHHARHCTGSPPTEPTEGLDISLLLQVLADDFATEEDITKAYAVAATMPSFTKIWTPAEVKHINVAVSRLAVEFVGEQRPLDLFRLLMVQKVGCHPAFTKGKLSVLSKRLNSYPYLQAGFPTIMEVRRSGRGERSLREAVHGKVAQGRSGAASKLLTDTLGVAKATGETLAKLRQLHPQEKAHGWESRDAPVLEVDLADVTDDCRKFSRETSGGPSGFDGQMLQVVNRNEDFLKALTVLANAICSGKAPLRCVLLASRLVPLMKDDQGGIRPIAVGEVFYRVCAKTIARKAEASLLDYQFGVGSKNGVEPIVHEARSKGKRNVVVQFDFRNAFNSINRQCMHTAVLKHAPELLRPMEWAYGVHSPLFVNGKVELMSQSGVKQGDPLSPLLFSLAVRPMAEQITEDLRAVGIVSQPQRYYLDDLVLFVKKKDLKKAERAVVNVCKDFEGVTGLVLRPEKTKRCTPRTFKRSGCEVLGSHVGGGTEKFLRDKFTELEAQVLKLREVALQDGYLVMTKCLRPKLNHLLRTVKAPASLWSKADRIFLDYVRDLTSQVGKPLGAVQKTVTSLPQRLGGLGISLPSVVAPECFAASVAECSESPGPSQRQRLDALWKSLGEKLHEALPAASRKVLRDGSSRLGRKWLHTFPSERYLTFRDEEFSAAIGERLLFKQTRCRMCNKMVDFDHAQHCKAIQIQRLRTIRHHVVKHHMAKAFQSTGAAVVVEKKANNNEARAADLLVTGGCVGGSRALDITFCSATGPRACRSSTTQIRPVLQQRFDDKMKQNVNLDYGGRFLPVVLSSGGTLHEATEHLFQEMFEQAPRVTDFMMYSLSVALRKFAARSVMDCFIRPAQDKD